MNYIKLGDICNIRTGKLNANASTSNGKYPFFTCSNEPLRIDTCSFDCECVLVAGNGDLNVKYYEGKFDAYQRTYVIESKSKGKYSTKYLYLFLESKIKELRHNSVGGVIKYIKLNNLTDLLVPDVDIYMQNIIVDSLFKVDKSISIKEGQIQKLDELTKSQFIEMFGDIQSNDKNWNKTDLLGNLVIFNPKKSEISDYEENTNVSFIPMQCVTTAGKIMEPMVRKLRDVWSGFTYFKDNDILFAKITPCMENGKGAIAKNLINGIGFGTTEFHVIRVKEVLNNIWLFNILQSKRFRKEAEEHMTGSAGQKRVPISFFENYKIAIPPIELQNKFANIVKQIDKQKFSNNVIINFLCVIINIDDIFGRIYGKTN